MTPLRDSDTQACYNRVTSLINEIFQYSGVLEESCAQNAFIDDNCSWDFFLLLVLENEEARVRMAAVLK